MAPLPPCAFAHSVKLTQAKLRPAAKRGAINRGLPPAQCARSLRTHRVLANELAQRLSVAEDSPDQERRAAPQPARCHGTAPTQAFGATAGGLSVHQCTMAVLTHEKHDTSMCFGEFNASVVTT
eukprot:689060-Prymnesium_polylepis.1